MLLRDLLKDTGVQCPPSCADHSVETISCDSRETISNGLFVALPGLKVNGADFIKDAMAQGARVIAKQGSGRVLDGCTIPDDVCVLDVADPRAFLRLIAPKFYGHPAD